MVEPQDRISQPVMIDTRLAAEISGVGMATIRQWVHRGHLIRQTDGGIDVRALIDWLDRRDARALANRAGITDEEVRRAIATGSNRAARLYAEARKAQGELTRVTPDATPETPDYGGWLRPRRV